MKNNRFIILTGTVALALSPIAALHAADEMKPANRGKTGIAGMAEPSSMGEKFMMKAAMGGMTEVKLGKLAAEKGASNDVKDFGKMMVKDHSTANKALIGVAKKSNVKLPEDLDTEHKKAVEKLSGMEGAAFDKAYVADMVKDHKKDIAEFEKAEKEVQDPTLKEFIVKTLPTLRMHMEKIQAISATMKKS